MVVEHELADLVLAERRSIGAVREALAATLPDGIELVGLYDVWLGAPPLAASLAGADYRVMLADEVDAQGLRRAAATLLEADALPRKRLRGAAEVDYDLRPLLGDIEVVDAGLRVRTLFDAARGFGRPEEVVAALGAVLGYAIEVREIVRERVILADDPV